MFLVLTLRADTFRPFSIKIDDLFFRKTANPIQKGCFKKLFWRIVHLSMLFVLIVLCLGATATKGAKRQPDPYTTTRNTNTASNHRKLSTQAGTDRANDRQYVSCYCYHNDSSRLNFSDNGLLLIEKLKMASYTAYLNSQPRKDLLSSANDGTATGPFGLDSNDAGNWTGCGVGQGQLIGTWRDWSACAEYSYRLQNGLYTWFTAADLRSLSRQDVANRMRPQWNLLGGDQIANQDVANIAMHTFLHFGNVRPVQQALKNMGYAISVDGSAGNQTRSILQDAARKSPVMTYNAIRDELERRYQSQYAAYPGFIIALNKDFPRKSSGSASALFFSLAVGVTAAIVIKQLNNA